MASRGSAERVTAKSLNAGVEETTLTHNYEKTGDNGVAFGGRNARGLARGGWVWSIVLFIFFVFIVFIILVAWCPKWLLRLNENDCDDDSSKSKSRGGFCGKKRRQCIDYGKTFLWAIVISVIAILLFWLLTAVTAGLATLFMGGNRRNTVC